jgi:hypothetical protein
MASKYNIHNNLIELTGQVLQHLGVRSLVRLYVLPKSGLREPLLVVMNLQDTLLYCAFNCQCVYLNRLQLTASIASEKGCGR